MMQFDAALVIFIAGGISAVAVLVSKISVLCNKKRPLSSNSVYECGVEKTMPQGFYTSKNMVMVIMSIIIELICILLSLCCILDMTDNTWHGSIFLRFCL